MKTTLLFVLLLLTACVTQAQATDPVCVKEQTAPAQGSFHWPPRTQVKVYFASKIFTAEQRKKLLAAMNIWSEIGAKTGTEVSFVYAGDTDTIVRCPACLTVTRRAVYAESRRYYALFNPLELDREWLLISARIDLDFATTNAKALQGYMVHELGHGLGLRDCTTCKKKTTIMTGFPAINRHNGLIAPSHCDVEVVRQVYSPQLRDKNKIAVRPDSGQHQ